MRERETLNPLLTGFTFLYLPLVPNIDMRRQILIITPNVVAVLLLLTVVNFTCVFSDILPSRNSPIFGYAQINLSNMSIPQSLHRCSLLSCDLLTLALLDLTQTLIFLMKAFTVDCNALRRKLFNKNILHWKEHLVRLNQKHVA